MSEMPPLTQQRHRDNLTKCLSCLRKYLKKNPQKNDFSNSNELLNGEDDFVLKAEELRQAAKWIGTITGHITSEEILDVIFKDFCIGK